MSGKAAALPLITSCCYISTKPEIEGFRDQDFVLQIYLPEVENQKPTKQSITKK